MNLEEKAVELLNKLEAITVEHSDDAINLAMGVTQVAGIKEILFSLITVSIWIGIAMIIRWNYNYSIKKYEETHDDGWEVRAYIPLVIGAIFGGVVVFYEMRNIFNPWHWIYIFKPELGLANKLLGF